MGDISLSDSRIQIGENGGLSMIRLALYACGVAAGIGAWLVWREQKRTMRRLPVHEAAAMLQQAWADHHTRA